ncbi:PREDICTED: uncharacterized protein LOC105316104 [Amphimedon queenslandica]|uniref:Integrase catalytic domain-containing protein n=1 Tax=Amphimedon queenslandica TaxID=400682 RepID=A0AAN0IU76_AMPQE|nr:PREDICTED: uncharacterized protein LOC105316104 [Amphimedon queenslandica]|eukprot:XP_011409212.1 PREDICTED: uncharacterized protein LOC105316104 [Amphimedon queenslandica]
MLSTLLSKTVEVLKHLFSMYVLLEQLVSDNGPQFPSDEFHQFIKSSGIKHYCSATYHPATKGAAEKFVQMLKQALKTEKQAGKPTKENGEVAQILGPRLLLVKLDDGSMVKKHIDQVQHRIVTSKEVTEDLLQDLDLPLPTAQQEEEPLLTTSAVDEGVQNSTNTTPVVPQQRYPLRDRRPPDRFVCF